MQKKALEIRKICITLFALFLSYGSITAQEMQVRRTPYVSWSPDGQNIAVSGNDKIEILDATTLEIVQEFLDTGETRTAAIWSSDSQRIGFDRGSNFELWSNIKNTPVQDTVFHDVSGGQAYAWSPNDQIIAIAYGDYIRFLDAVNYIPLGRYNSEGLRLPLSLDWDSNSNNILIGSSLNVQILDFTAMIPLLSFILEPYVNSRGEFVNPVALSAVWSPSEQQIAIGSDDSVRILNLSDYANEEFAVLSPSSSFYGHEGEVYSVSWHPSGQYVASSGADGTIRIWDIVSGQQINMIEFPDNIIVQSVAWSPDGTQLAYGSPTGTAEVVLIPSVSILPAPSIICTATAADTPALLSAIASANATPEADTICLEGRYTLTTSNGANGLPVITSDITLHGLGAGAEIVGEVEVSGAGRLVLINVSVNP